MTSANYSFYGLHENIEVGVKVRSPLVTRLVQFFLALTRTAQVRELDWMEGEPTHQ